jgi:monooxygenase
LQADVIVTATGLTLQSNFPMSTMNVIMDGKPYDAPSAILYKSMMVSGVPNFAFTIGYTSASWTLKADMTSAYICRLINYMDAEGMGAAVPQANGVVGGM